MIRTMQNLLDVGLNAFGLRIVAKDMMKLPGVLAEDIHVPFPMAEGKTVWVTFSLKAPKEATPPLDELADAKKQLTSVP